MLEVRIPKMGASTVDVDLTKWHVSVGTSVVPGQILAEVESEKTNIEIEAETAGVVAEILVDEGAVTGVGTVICRIKTE
ncbi:biotin/lipoyl-containing protein [Mesorhizobium sp. L103C105A0]|uniref:biotin/lipoyl-containing protein n=1 Tax=unclassified Mesorhizobium TaxID=325217 RepID=UPI000406C962|nr:biotin/lipoyl-containing protein [Mesorhizobium sp. L103C105A0]